MASLAHLPFDCLFDISSFLGLGSVRSLLLTCSSLHSQLTTSHSAMFIWITQLNYFLIAEIAFLQKESAGKNKHDKVIVGLNSQLRNQENLLRRLQLRVQRQRKERGMGNGVQEEENRVENEEIHTSFSVYHSLKQLYFSGVVRRLRSQMNAIVERMKVAKSIRELFVLFEEAVVNNDLSMFKNEGEWKRMERQEALLWNDKGRATSFLSSFLHAIFKRKEDLANSEDADALVQRIIQILEHLVNKHGVNATGEGNGITPLLVVINIRNLKILKAFIPLYNQSLIQDKSAQRKLLFDPNKMREDALACFLPLSMAIKEFVHTDMVDLILEEVYEPCRKEMIVAVLNSGPVRHNSRYYSILDYELSWIKSIISLYEIDVSTLSDQIYSFAIKSKSSSSTYELIQYFYSQGLRMKNTVKDEHDNPFISLIFEDGYRRVEQQAIKCMELLLAAGGELDDLPIFDRLISGGVSVNFFQFLAKNGANPNVVGSYQRFPPLLNLISAASYTEKGVTVVRWLLECGADPTLFFPSNSDHYQNCHMSALRMAYHKYAVATNCPRILATITSTLAEYGITKETEKPDPDGLTFDQWLEIVRSRI